jgi:hypothetical protein
VIRARLLVLGLLAVLAGAIAGPILAAGPAAASALPANPWYHLDESGELRIDLWFAWSSTCPHCAKAKPVVEAMDRELPWLDVHSLQLDGTDVDATVATLLALGDLVGEDVRYVPSFLYGGRLRVGFDEAATTGVTLRAELVAYHDEVARSLGLITPPPSAPAPTASPSATPGAAVTIPFIGSVDAATVSLPILAVVLGALDAFNPCALSVLLFLLSVLVGARSRQRMALVGGTFVAVSGIVYFLLMAAWLNLFLAFGALRVVTVLAGVAAVAAALINVKDYAWYGHGPSLVIPISARPALFGRILDLSEATRLPALLASTVLVAAVANSYEMLCTGGFPVVFTRVLTLNDLPVAAYYGYLALYNVVYVAPLLAIVLVFAWTMGTGRIGELEARRLKLLSGLLMLGFGLLLMLMPDRLGDLATSLGLFAGAVATWAAIVATERFRRAVAVVSPKPRAGPGRRGA